MLRPFQKLKFRSSFSKNRNSFNAVDMVMIYEKSCDYQLKKTNNGWIGRCPFSDHEDKSPSFVIWPDIDQYKCYGCGRSGNGSWFRKVMQDQTGISMPLTRNTHRNNKLI